ncbi:Structural maintenance of chromosomes protein 6, partial [Tulasnella sp. 427]
ERDDLHQLEKHPARYRAKADEVQAQIDQFTDQSKALEEKLNADQEANTAYQEERTNVQERIKRNALKIQECQEEEREINRTMAETQKTIDDLNQRIEAESRKLEQNEASKRQQILDQLTGVVSRLTAKEGEFQRLNQDRDEILARGKGLQDEIKGATAHRAQVQQQIQDAQGWQQRLQDQQRNKLNLFGHNIDKILDEIAITRWQGADPPIGPLGLYVSLKDGTYRNVLQNQLGNFMYQFVVSHPADRRRLGEILQRHRNQAAIVIAERDIFDYSQGLPRNPRIVTPMHVLEFTDEWVPRILINALSIERIGLTHTRAEADDMAERDPGRMYWSADQFRVTKFSDGGFSSQNMPVLKRSDTRRQLFSDQDTATQLREAQEREQQHQHELNVINNKLTQANVALHEAGQRRDRIHAQGRRLQQEIAELKRQKETLEEQSKEEAPQEVAGLEALRNEQIESKERYKESFGIVYDRRLQIEAENRPLLARGKELREHLEQANDAENRIHAEMSKLFDRATQARSNHKHYRDKLAEAERNKLAVTEEEYTTWHAKASEYCAEVLSPRRADVVRKEVEALEKAVKQRERKQGASVDEMEAECVRTKRALEKTNSAIKGLEEMAHKLEYAVKVRIETWHYFRRNIALRTKVQFGYHLAVRSFFGNLQFDHVKSTLNLTVMTADQAQAQGTQRAKEARSLSGGEKSYTQVCLLLALWESVGCPIRCLDEFDVFLDAPNRGICMNLLAEAAKSSEAKQYFFITPLDTGNFIKPDPPVVKISQMKEPNRNAHNIGQRRLPFRGE